MQHSSGYYVTAAIKEFDEIVKCALDFQSGLSNEIPFHVSVRKQGQLPNCSNFRTVETIQLNKL